MCYHSLSGLVVKKKNVISFDFYKSGILLIDIKGNVYFSKKSDSNFLFKHITTTKSKTHNKYYLNNIDNRDFIIGDNHNTIKIYNSCYNVKKIIKDELYRTAAVIQNSLIYSVGSNTVIGLKIYDFKSAEISCFIKNLNSHGKDFWFVTSILNFNDSYLIFPFPLKYIYRINKTNKNISKIVVKSSNMAIIPVCGACIYDNCSVIMPFSRKKGQKTFLILNKKFKTLKTVVFRTKNMKTIPIITIIRYKSNHIYFNEYSTGIHKIKI